MNKKKEIFKRGVAVWMFNPHGQVLMGLRLSKHGNGTWAPPGGKPEIGETLIDTAVREVAEETGIILDQKMLKCVGQIKDFFPEQPFITTHYRIDNVMQIPFVMEQNKCAEWRWFDMKKLPKPLFLSAQNLLKQKVFGV